LSPQRTLAIGSWLYVHEKRSRDQSSTSGALKPIRKLARSFFTTCKPPLLAEMRSGVSSWPSTLLALAVPDSNNIFMLSPRPHFVARCQALYPTYQDARRWPSHPPAELRPPRLFGSEQLWGVEPRKIYQPYQD